MMKQIHGDLIDKLKASLQLCFTDQGLQNLKCITESFTQTIDSKLTGEAPQKARPPVQNSQPNMMSTGIVRVYNFN